MSEAFAKWAKPKEQPAKKHSPDEQRALKKLQREADEAGATLATDGEGGLLPSLCLGCYRRDKFRCKKCGGKENLSLHHKHFHMEDPRHRAKAALVQKQGRRNDPDQIATICAACHDKIHEEDRDGTK